MKHHNDKNKLSRKLLLPSEYEAYRKIGEVDMDQNWLEIFTPELVSDLFTIKTSCSDNPRKAGYIRDEMADYGFEELGLGTNIYAMANPAYPGVAFKFALDDNGIADNFNDSILQEDPLLAERFAKTLARHPSGIVSVQERKVPISDPDRMDTFRPGILKYLQKVSKDYLVVDLCPDMTFNYCVERNGDWGILDGSDLYPLSRVKEKIRCHKAVGYDYKKGKVVYCGGHLNYNEDFSRVVCNRCGLERIPSEIRPKEKEGSKVTVDICFDGTTEEYREQIRLMELSMFHQLEDPVEEDEEEPEEEDMGEPIPEPEEHSIFVVPPPEDDDDLEEEEPENEEEEEDLEDLVDVSEPGYTEVPTEEGGELEYPHIEYKIDSEGLYLNVVGNFDDAFEESGVPVYVSLNGNEYVMAIKASTVKKVLDRVIPEIEDEF